MALRMPRSPEGACKLFYFEHPHLAPREMERAQIGCSSKDTLIQVRFLISSFCLDSGVGHARETLAMGTPGSLWGWALQGVSGVGYSRETLGLGWALQGDSLWVWGTSSFWGWALQEVSGVGHSREALGVDRARRRVPGEEKS